jgi:hypothetical protein
VLLSELLEQSDFKAAKITVIGLWKTSHGEFVVLGPTGTPNIPVNLELQHPIEVTPGNHDPDLDHLVVLSIRRRFGLDKSGFSLKPEKR